MVHHQVAQRSERINKILPKVESTKCRRPFCAVIGHLVRAATQAALEEVMRHSRRKHFWIAPWALSVLALALALAACSRAEFSADPAPNQRVRPTTTALSKVERDSADLQAGPKADQVPNGPPLDKEPMTAVTDAKNSQGDDLISDQPKPLPAAPPEKEAPPVLDNATPNPPADNDTPSMSSVPSTDDALPPITPQVTPPIPPTPPPPSAHQDDIPTIVVEPPRDTPPVVSTPMPPEAPPVVSVPPDIAPSPSTPPPSEPGPSVVLKPCSQTPTDVTPKNSPILVAPIGDCITAGKQIFFSVSGSITFSRVDAPTDGNGSLSQIVHHQKGATLGKSDIIAPINSLIGVFLSDSDPAAMPAPATLDFSTQKARDYVSLSPAVGQVFFIGTGLTSTGEHHKIVVPQGTTRLYFAVMDIYQWNNNSGSLSGAIMTE